MLHQTTFIKTSVFLTLFTMFLAGCSGGNSSYGGDTGTATLTWDGPTTNADVGSTPLDDLAGYRVYMSTIAGQYDRANDRVADITAGSSNGGGTGITTTVSGLAPGTYYFVVTAHDGAGNESVDTSEVSKTIP